MYKFPGRSRRSLLSLLRLFVAHKQLRNSYWLLLLLFVSCSTSAGDEKPSKDSIENPADGTQTKIRDSAIAANSDGEGKKVDTVYIREASALMFSPDSLTIEKRKKELGEETFYTGADDYLYYMNLSNEYLEDQGLPVVLAETSQVLKFVSSPAKFEIIRLDTVPELWGVYLFRPGKPAHFADVIDMQADYKMYFGK